MFLNINENDAFAGVFHLQTYEIKYPDFFLHTFVGEKHQQRLKHTPNPSREGNATTLKNAAQKCVAFF